MTKRWVRFVMPIMVEVDCDEDELLRVVTLPEVRQDRDDRGHFLIYDERFVRRHGDDQPQTHACCVAEPYWEHERFRLGPRRWSHCESGPWSNPSSTKAVVARRGSGMGQAGVAAPGGLR